MTVLPSKADILAQIATLTGIPTPQQLFDRSTTITAANVSQQIFYYQPARTWCLIYNPCTPQVQLTLLIPPLFNAPVAGTLGEGGNLQIGPGEAYFWSTSQNLGACYQGAIAVIGLVPGMALYAWEAGDPPGVLTDEFGVPITDEYGRWIPVTKGGQSPPAPLLPIFGYAGQQLSPRISWMPKTIGQFAFSGAGSGAGNVYSPVAQRRGPLSSWKQHQSVFPFTGGAPAFLRSGAGPQGVSRRITPWWKRSSSEFSFRPMSSCCINVLDYGAVGDGVHDDTAAINAAVTACVVFNRSLYFPGTANFYKISSLLTIPSGSTMILYGDGPQNTVIKQTSATAGVFLFANPPNTLLPYGGMGIRDMSLVAAGTDDTINSTGVALTVCCANDNFEGRNIAIRGFQGGVALKQCWNTRWYNITVIWSSVDAIAIGPDVSYPASGGNLFVGVLTSNGGATYGLTGNGLGIYQSGGEYFAHCEFDTAGTGINVNPGVGQQVAYLFFDNCLVDTCALLGWSFNATNGAIVSATCDGCWSGYNTGNGLLVQGNCDSVRWLNGRIRENTQHGAQILSGAVHTAIIGTEIASNGRGSAAGTYDGINIAANVNAFYIQNNQIGNFASAYSAQGASARILSGASNNFMITGNTTISPGGGQSPIVNGSSAASSSYVIMNNFPYGNAGNNVESAGSLLSFSGASGAGGAGTTIYMGNGKSSVNENDCVMPVFSAGTVTVAYAAVSIAPGAGQSFTFTVRHNFVDTGITGTISGAASFTVTMTGSAFNTADGDSLDVKIVSSAGAAASQFRGYIVVNP